MNEKLTLKKKIGEQILITKGYYSKIILLRYRSNDTTDYVCGKCLLRYKGPFSHINCRFSDNKTICSDTDRNDCEYYVSHVIYPRDGIKHVSNLILASFLRTKLKSIVWKG